MYLKTLKMVGFKSFADRTHLEFRPGVTVVVGPNGSGKSNVVDALSWVLGTQSTKTLRTSQMEDVVFAGTATRPGLNRAEVTIVLDNVDRMLDLDLDEVAITRRLYRDGSTDYELNGVGCRLLDITELLSDSGVGRHQHVIVGQGRIERILSAGPDDHRAVIEEAAGVLKHRQRKERAIRRLERTDVDLDRLTDLIGELKRQMRPLKRQANAAQRYGDVRAEIRSLRLYLGGTELRRSDERLAVISDELKETETGLEQYERDLATARERYRQLDDTATDLGRTLDRESSAAARLETTIERLRTTASIAHERLRSGRDRLEGAEARRRDLVEERETLRHGLDEITGQLEEIAGRVENDERRFRDLEAEERSLADQASLTPEGALAVVRGEVRSLTNSQERDRHESHSIAKQLELLADRQSEDVTRRTQLETELEELDAQVMTASDEHVRIRQRREDVQARLESAQEDHRAALEAHTRAQARLEAITAAVGGGADTNSQRLLSDADGLRGSVQTLLDVPSDLAVAVDAALAPWVDALAFVDRGSMDAAVSALKSSGGGGVPLVTGTKARPDASRQARELGVDLLIDRLGPEADVGLARSLLGDVILVEGWSTAHGITENHPQLRAVTPEGDLIEAGAIRVAHPDGATPAMMESASVELERTDIEVSRAKSHLGPLDREFQEARQRERAALENLEALEAKLTVATEDLGRLRRSIESAATDRKRLDERSDALGEAISERTDRLQGLEERLAALEGEEAERQRVIADLDRQRETIAESRELARSQWQKSQGEERAARERRDMFAQRLGSVDDEIRQHDEHPVDAADLEQLATIESWARRAGSIADTRLTELRERQSGLRVKGGEATRRLEAATSAIERSRTAIEQAREVISRLEVERTELQVRREGVAEGLRRDADAEETEALEVPRPDIEGSEDQFPDILEQREKELKRMGPVNPLAAKEYAEIEERHDHIAEQLADLEASRSEVRKVIEALDSEIQARFLAAFEEISAAFERNFAILFPGGKGRMELVDPTDLLTSGVEIAAQPLGKKVEKMSLLSGGERSLAALAFLFSVFEARPSPFYVLDEVEAALDDANLRRFLRLLDAFRTDSQLVIITHQQQTMEAADVLYGVTMEPGGSSQVLRQDVSTAPTG